MEDAPLLTGTHLLWGRLATLGPLEGDRKTPAVI